MEGTRKSVRMRAAPEVFVLPPAQEPARARAKARPPRPEDATDVNLGQGFQADLPLVRPRPPAPTAEEERHVAGLVCQAGDVAPPQLDAQQAAAMAAASQEERCAGGGVCGGVLLGCTRCVHDRSLPRRRAVSRGALDALRRFGMRGHLPQKNQSARKRGPGGRWGSEERRSGPARKAPLRWHWGLANAAPHGTAPPSRPVFFSVF